MVNKNHGANLEIVDLFFGFYIIRCRPERLGIDGEPSCGLEEEDLQIEVDEALIEIAGPVIKQRHPHVGKASAPVVIESALPQIVLVPVRIASVWAEALPLFSVHLVIAGT